ncbi:MAG TPA: EAL domain-containing protein [Vicinamibacteria bacterium]|nr:EAL domain-containing protein [Vicinamibacteria bacterium]
MRRHSFQTRLLSLMVWALVLLQAATLVAVHVAGQRNLRQTLAEELRVGARVLNRILAARGRQLTDTARVLAADFAFREAIASADRPTLTSALVNLGTRIDGHVLFLISLDGSVDADTLGGHFVSRPFPVPSLVPRGASPTGAAAIVTFDNRPFQFVVVPVLAPQPIALVCIGFTIDEAVLEDVQRLTALELSLWAPNPGAQPLLISTLPQDKQSSLRERIRDGGVRGETLQLGSDTYQTMLQPIDTGDASAINVLLQRSLEEAQGPLRKLELQIFELSGAALLMAIVAAIFFARGVTSPLRRLAEAAQRIGRGDYSTPVESPQDEEMAQLATAFNRMGTEIGGREEQIRFQGSHDGLTGLPNRTLFLDRLALWITSAKRRGALVGMVMMDLDRFKEINDTLGHSLGDDLLVEIGRRLRQTIRESDTVARLGGDEFAVMFEIGAAPNAVEVAQRIGGAFETPFTLGGVSIDVKASMGIALYPPHAEDAGTLMKRADVAMYEAKRSHRAYALYEPGRDEHSLRRLAILSELRQAVASDALELHYQPKIDIATDRAIHAEALVRWLHPVHGMMAPDEFIPLAEQSGNIGMITKWVLRRAIGDCAGWNRAGFDLGVAVNLSALDLYDAELPTLISGLLHDQGLHPSKLVLEITESAIMKDAAYALKTLRDVKTRGITLAIDDYGTGYSSLAHLKRFPLDELKIDKSFTMNLGQGATEDSVIVRSTIDLGHNMGLKVVAEGVESASGYAILKRFGCDMVQGYFISRPLPPPQFLAWMTESQWGLGSGVSSSTEG